MSAWPAQDDDEKGTYLYQPLQDDRTIRLFRLAPAWTQDAPIKVEFLSCSLESANIPSFETISYLWGSPGEQAQIYCEGKRLTIPKNLTDALLYLRSKYRPRILWTDSISINQQDGQEKATQIGLMATITWLAARSNVWIGPSLASIKSAFELLSKLREVRTIVLSDSDPKQVPTLQKVEDYRRRLPPPNSQSWKALEKLLDTKLLTRAWTMPDIVSSKNPVLCCGMEIPWIDACYGLESYALYSHPNVIKSPGLKTILQFEYLRQCHRQGQILTLDIYLGVTRSLNATEERDKIYASYGIFGLANPEAPLPIDYSLPVREVYDRVARALNSGGLFGPFLAAFSLIEDNESQESRDNLLSWMPDWSKPLNRYRLNQTCCDFNASGSVSPDNLQHTQRNRDSDAELFDGLMIDRIDKVSSFLPPRRFHDKFNASGANAFFFQEWYEWAEENAMRAHNGDVDRLLLHWIETVQAKGCNITRDHTWADSTQLLSQSRTWLKYLEDEDQEQTEEIRQLHASALPSHGRRFGITARGHFCLVPRWTRANDAVCILYGAKVPFVLREGEMKSRKVAGNWRNVGECYVHSGMHGEALEWEGVQEMVFDIR